MDKKRETTVTLGLSDLENALITESGPMFLIDNGDSDLDEPTPRGSWCCCVIELDRENRKVHVTVQKWDGPDLGRHPVGTKLESSDSLFEKTMVPLREVDLPNETAAHIQSHGFDSDFLLLLLAYSETFVAWHHGVCSQGDFCSGVSNDELGAVERLIDTYLRPLATSSCKCGKRALKLVSDLDEVGY